MRLFYTATLLLLVAGCSSDLWPNQLEEIAKMCSNNGGLKFANVSAPNSVAFTTAYCEDGTEIRKNVSTRIDK